MVHNHKMRQNITKEDRREMVDSNANPQQEQTATKGRKGRTTHIRSNKKIGSILRSGRKRSRGSANEPTWKVTVNRRL